MNNHPVLLVHGLDDTGLRLKKLKTNLENKGFKLVQAMDIWPSDGSISFEEMAGQIAGAAKKLMLADPEGKIDIVAYSMGTLAVRFYLQKLGGCTSVRRFISIAGPHHGTLTAYLRQNSACRQMRPGSVFLNDLNKNKHPWGPTRVFSFLTVFDLMIFPTITSWLPDAQNKVFFTIAHPLTVSDPWVINAVCWALMDP